MPAVRFIIITSCCAHYHRLATYSRSSHVLFRIHGAPSPAINLKSVHSHTLSTFLTFLLFCVLVHKVMSTNRGAPDKRVLCHDPSRDANQSHCSWWIVLMLEKQRRNVSTERLREGSNVNLWARMEYFLLCFGSARVFHTRSRGWQRWKLRLLQLFVCI